MARMQGMLILSEPRIKRKKITKPNKIRPFVQIGPSPLGVQPVWAPWHVPAPALAERLEQAGLDIAEQTWQSIDLARAFRHRGRIAPAGRVGCRHAAPDRSRTGS
jgi:hypothetical protein